MDASGVNWKSPPTDPQKMWINKSCEIQILLACNWNCISCDQGSQFSAVSWVKRGTMRMTQIEHFVREMHEHNAFIGRLRLVGGEPSLHPELIDMVKFLHRSLVERGHVHRLELVTNGSKPERLQPVKHLLRVRVSNEADKAKHHVANFINTPASLGYAGKVCSAPWHCGFSLCHFGFFPCSSGAGVARFMDWMPQWQRLTLPTCVKPCNAVRECWPDLPSLCSHCYHGLSDADKHKSGTSDPARNAPGEHIKQHLDSWFAGKQPNWPVYGAPVLAG